MHHSVYIELTIVCVSFAVALAAIWRLHSGEQYIRKLESENAALHQQLDEFRGQFREIGNGFGLRYCGAHPERGWSSGRKGLIRKCA